MIWRTLAGALLLFALPCVSPASRPVAHDSPLGRGPEDLVGVFLRSPVVSPAWERPRGRAQDTSSPVLVPFLVDRIRERTVVQGRLWLVEWLRDGEPMELSELRILVNRRLLRKQALDLSWTGQLEYPRLASDLERLPAALTHARRRQNYFQHPRAERIRGAAAQTRAADLFARWNAWYEEASPADEASRPRPEAIIDFELDLADVFPADTQPGTLVDLRFELTGRQPTGQRATYFCERQIEWSGPAPTLPPGALPKGLTAIAVDPLVHPPHDRGAETTEPASNAKPKTATRPAPWPVPSCPELAFPGTLSAEGQAASLRALGVSPIRLTPPAAGTLAWKGEFQRGQGREVATWIEALAGGGPAVAFAGSDAHEEPFAAGFTHVLVEAPTRDALQQALDSGRSFLSNGPALVLEARQGDRMAHLGESIEWDTEQPGSLLLAGAFEGDGVRWQVFVGQVGSTREVELFTGELEAGQTDFKLELPLPTLPTAVPLEGWVRAYAERDGAARVAYTNAIYLRTKPPLAPESSGGDRPDESGS